MQPKPLMELVNDWREIAGRLRNYADRDDLQPRSKTETIAEADRVDGCADQLEAALRAHAAALTHKHGTMQYDESDIRKDILGREDSQ